MSRRVTFSVEQKKAYKLKDFKGWVVKQMKLTGKTQSDVGKALGLSQSMVSARLKIPGSKSSKRINPDPFSYGDLFDLFDTDEEEMKRLLTL